MQACVRFCVTFGSTSKLRVSFEMRHYTWLGARFRAWFFMHFRVGSGVWTQLGVSGAYLRAQLFGGGGLGAGHWGKGAEWTGEAYWAQGTGWTIGAKGAWCTAGHCAREKEGGGGGRDRVIRIYMIETLEFPLNKWLFSSSSVLPRCLAVSVPLDELFLCSPSNTSWTLQNSFWMCLRTSSLCKKPGQIK